MGEPVEIADEPVAIITRSGKPDNGEGVIPTVPLRKLNHPGQEE